MLVKFYLLFSLLLLLGLNIAGQEEAFELIHLHEKNPTIAISVSKEDMPIVSSNILAAESWLKSHVLSRYPSTNISTITVGKNILCNKSHQQQWSLILPTVKNLYHSLTRWGLLKDIKVSAAFSSRCFEANTAEKSLKSLLTFLDDASLPYTIYQSSYLEVPTLPNIIKKLSPLEVHQMFLERLGFSKHRDVRIIKESKHIERKLSSLQFAPVPGSSLSFAPENSPFVGPAKPPDVSADPPLQYCLPPVSGPAPSVGEGEKVGLWCVAKPSVPEEKLLEAMEYACGEGGADCEEIRPYGNCYNPNNLVAHASYAFNSYWQKTKMNGGSCYFDGTAIIINSDPSYLHCRFDLS